MWLCWFLIYFRITPFVNFTQFSILRSLTSAGNLNKFYKPPVDHVTSTIDFSYFSSSFGGGGVLGGIYHALVIMRFHFDYHIIMRRDCTCSTELQGCVMYVVEFNLSCRSLPVDQCPVYDDQYTAGSQCYFHVQRHCHQQSVRWL